MTAANNDEVSGDPVQREHCAVPEQEIRIATMFPEPWPAGHRNSALTLRAVFSQGLM